MKTNFFKDKKILVLGGTGSIGKQILHSLFQHNPKMVKVFSRDEYKQHKLRYKYFGVKNIDYILGDIRDLESLQYACKDIDIIFHAAALKHVPISEEMPEEFIKTNILGSLNVKKAALENKVPLIVTISSDKAVDPTNVMGLTKNLQEKIFASHYLKEKTKGIKFVSVRFGNVIGTHGSLFPIIYDQILHNQPITVTCAEMTRFYMSPEEATGLIFWAAMNGNDGEIVIKKMKSTSIESVVKNFIHVMKKDPKWPIRSIGIRVGEKLHEALITEDNFYRTKEKQGYYVVSPYRAQDLTNDELLIDAKKVEERRKFVSDHPANFFTDQELQKYIKDFIKNNEVEREII